MAGARCTCGFAEAASEDYTIDDHLYEMFAPDDGIGPDGQVHLEGKVSLFCMCGAGGDAGKLEAHFLEVFTPVNHVGRDRWRHVPVQDPPRRWWDDLPRREDPAGDAS